MFNLLVSLALLVVNVAQAMDRPTQDKCYASVPNEIKVEILDIILQSHDIASLKNFALACKANKRFVSDYLDDIIHRALASSNPKKGIRFLYELKQFDAGTAKKVGEYISQDDFNSLLEDRDEDESLFIVRAVKLRNYNLAKIMLENPAINDVKKRVDLLKAILLEAGPLQYYGYRTPEKLPEMLEFFELIPKYITMDPIIVADTIERAMSNEFMPFPFIKLMVNQLGTEINHVSSKFDMIQRKFVKRTLLDVANALRPYDYDEANAFAVYKKELIKFLRSKKAKTYKELQAEQE